MDFIPHKTKHHYHDAMIHPSCAMCGHIGRDICAPCYNAFIMHKHPAVYTFTVKGGGAFASETTTRMGANAEDRFRRMCNANGLIFREATKYENTRLHFDFLVKKKDNNYARVEVKAMKAARRGCAPDPDIIYVETKNVIGGAGWVYGAADEIAFEQPWGFIIVPRIALVEMTEYYKNTARRAHMSGIPYTLYGRMNRQDEVLILRTSDLHKLPMHKFV